MSAREDERVWQETGESSAAVLQTRSSHGRSRRGCCHGYPSCGCRDHGYGSVCSSSPRRAAVTGTVNTATAPLRPGDPFRCGAHGAGGGGRIPAVSIQTPRDRREERLEGFIYKGSLGGNAGGTARGYERKFEAVVETGRENQSFNDDHLQIDRAVISQVSCLR
ncbi:unnamed protein product [Gadus morhua 'NCC']